MVLKLPTYTSTGGDDRHVHKQLKDSACLDIMQINLFVYFFESWIKIIFILLFYPYCLISSSYEIIYYECFWYYMYCVGKKQFTKL